MTNNVSVSSIVVAKPDVASCMLGTGSALLDLERSKYFSMNAVAAEIWDRIQQPARVGELVDLVKEKFETGNADVQGDVVKLLSELEQLRLVTISYA
jgi:hypothetical protein